jgi:hypothetical protein
MGISAGPSGVSDGLVFQLDAANLRSYSGSGIAATGLVGSIGATFVNGTGFSSNNSGSFFFDGTNDYINIPSPTNLLSFGTNNFTISLWLYPTYVYSGSGFYYQTILSNYTSYQSDFISYLHVVLFNSDFYKFYDFISILDSTGNYISGFGISLSINQWSNVVFTKDGTTFSGYKNGIGSTSVTKAGVNYSGSRNTKIGGGVSTVATLSGNMSDIKLYNRALSATEVLQNFNAMRERYNL